jgi:hypothetical protein
MRGFAVHDFNDDRTPVGWHRAFGSPETIHTANGALTGERAGGPWPAWPGAGARTRVLDTSSPAGGRLSRNSALSRVSYPRTSSGPSSRYEARPPPRSPSMRGFRSSRLQRRPNAGRLASGVRVAGDDPHGQRRTDGERVGGDGDPWPAWPGAPARTSVSFPTAPGCRRRGTKPSSGEAFVPQPPRSCAVWNETLGPVPHQCAVRSSRHRRRPEPGRLASGVRVAGDDPHGQRRTDGRTGRRRWRGRADVAGRGRPNPSFSTPRALTAGVCHETRP